MKEEIRVNVLNRPYGGFPWLLLPPVLFDTFPNAHNGYGDFVDLESATVDGRRGLLRPLLRAGQRGAGRRRRLRPGRGAGAGRAALRRHPGARRRRPRPDFAEPAPTSERRESLHRPAGAGAGGRGRLAGARPGGDFDAYLPYVVLAEVLIRGDASRLEQRLVQTRPDR